MDQPIDYPNSSDLLAIVREAIREGAKECVLKPLMEELEPDLGDYNYMFNDSVAYRTPASNGSPEMFTGASPVQQILGHVLYHPRDALIVMGEDDLLLSKESLQAVRVTRDTSTNTVSASVSLNRCPSLIRYLDYCGITYSIREDRVITGLSIHCPPGTSEPMLEAARQLKPALSIYYKLITRFPLCEYHSIHFPNVRNS